MRVFHRDIQTRETMYANTSSSVFVDGFRVFGYPGATLARVVHIESQLNKIVMTYIALYNAAVEMGKVFLQTVYAVCRRVLKCACMLY